TVSQVVKCGNHILNIRLGIKNFFYVVLFIVVMGFMIYMIELNFYIFGISTLINISNKPVWYIGFFINIGFISILNFKKPFNPTGGPTLSHNMINVFAVNFAILYCECCVSCFKPFTIAHLELEPLPRIECRFLGKRHLQN